MGQQEPFGGTGQTQTSQPISVVGTQELFPFEPFNRKGLIRISAGQAVDLGGGKLTGESRQRQQKAGQCVRGRQRLFLIARTSTSQKPIFRPGSL